MKVYCPSHNRPDSKLFSITTGLNIVLQYEEDVETYSKWKDQHNIIYVPELKGLLDARNWILEQSNDWVMMTDDDIEVLEIKDNKKVDISWDKFLTETESIKNELDNDKIGVVGFNRNGNTIFTEQYQEEKFDLYHTVILNAPLLKSKGFKYEGYPFDGVGGQRAYCEDTDLLYWCYVNDIKNIKINYLCIKHDSKRQTVVWESFKNREKMFILATIWLLDKYKDYALIIDTCNKALQYVSLTYDRNELYNELVNEVSYETLHIITGEEEMKKNVLIGGLIVFLFAGFVGCSNGNNNDDDDDIDTRVIAEQYRGTWEMSNGENAKPIYLTETHYYFGGFLNDGTVTQFIYMARAYTEDGKLIKVSLLHGGEGNALGKNEENVNILGEFKDDGTFDDYVSGNNTINYKKK